MDIENALLAFLTQGRDLITDNRPLRLRLDHPTGMLEDVLLPQRVYGSEAICGGIEYRVMCVSLDAHLPLKELIALPAAVDIVTDTGELRTVCGIVTEASAGESDGGLASYQLLIQDALAVMEKRTNTRVFRNMNEVDIVCALLDEWRRTNAIIAACFEYEIDEIFKLQTYPRREFTMQYNESDAAFIRRLLKRRGICWYFQAKPPFSHKLVLFNRTDSLPQSAAAIVRFHRDAATEEADSVTSWSAIRRVSASESMVLSWDYREPRNQQFMTSRNRSSQELGSSAQMLCATIKDVQIASPHVADDYDDLCQIGELLMRRNDAESKCFEGQGGVRAFRAGEYFSLAGHAEIDTHPESEREFVITSLHLIAQNNLPRDLAERVERLATRSGWNNWGHGMLTSMQQDMQRTRIRFTAVRRSLDIVPAYDARASVPQVPMQSAIVVGPEGEVVHCDDLGRVKIKFFAPQMATDDNDSSAWVRVVSGWAGSGPGSHYQCGTVTLPRVGSEVLIAFLGGDPDKPVIVGQLFNSSATPPALKSSGGLRRDRYISGIRSLEVGGEERTNSLIFDDTAGEISAELASDHGSSKISLGLLTAIDDDGRRTPRGNGIDLRTDLYAAIRGEEGVLVTAESGESQLDREELKRLAAGAQALSEQLSKLAEKSTSQRVPEGESAMLMQRLTELQETGSRIVALSGPEGILAASGQALSLSAATDVSIVSSGNTCLSSAGSAAICSAKGLNAFAHRGGANLVAAAGKVQVQAQTDALELLARKVLAIISTTDWINITAKQGVRINGGGSELVINADGIKGYTRGKSEMYAADHQTFKGRGVTAEFPGVEVCEQQAAGASQSGAATVPVKGT